MLLVELAQKQNYQFGKDVKRIKMTDNTIMVEKRDGSLEPLNLEKLHKMTFEATDGLAGVSASQVEMNSGLQFFNGIK